MDCTRIRNARSSTNATTEDRLRSKLGMPNISLPEDIDLDLVFEANLEQQKEERRYSSSAPNLGFHASYKPKPSSDRINNFNYT